MILYTIIFGFAFNFLTSAMTIIIPTIAVENTSKGSTSLSIFYICELVGKLLGGSIIIKKRNRKLLTYLLIGSVGEGVVMSIMGLSLFAEGVIVIVMAIILLVNGIFSELLNIPLRVWYKKLNPIKVLFLLKMKKRTVDLLVIFQSYQGSIFTANKVLYLLESKHLSILSRFYFY